MKTIAVYVNQVGATSTFKEPGFIRLYGRNDSEWILFKEYPNTIDFSMGISEIRIKLNEVVQKLDDCNIFVAKEISGQLYYVLEANAFNTYEAEGKPEEYLDSIWEVEQSEMKKKNDDKKDSTPIILQEQTDRPGVYSINLTKALNQNGTLSSKQILRPFLQKKKFESLEILCDHIPRWFETDLKRFDTIVTKQSENEYKVSIITKK